MKRYTMDTTFEYGIVSRETADGYWVRFDDVHAFELELGRCIVQLEKLAHERALGVFNPVESARLGGKIEGVKLALSKLAEAQRQ